MINAIMLVRNGSASLNVNSFFFRASLFLGPGLLKRRYFIFLSESGASNYLEFLCCATGKLGIHSSLSKLICKKKNYRNTSLFHADVTNLINPSRE